MPTQNPLRFRKFHVWNQKVFPTISYANYVIFFREEKVPGEILKKKREELGYNLKEIAKTLKIRSDYLKAIEEGTFEKLPVEVYTKGYIREYAKFLKTDPEVVIKAYIEKLSPPVIEKQPDPITPAENTVKEGIIV